MIYEYGMTTNKLGNVFLIVLMSAKRKLKALKILFMISLYVSKKRKLTHIDAGSNTFTSMNGIKVAR